MNTDEQKAELGRLLSGDPYAPFTDRQLTFLKDRIRQGISRHPGYENYIRHWPVPFEQADRLEDLPYLPVSIFKRTPPIALVDDSALVRIAQSSATTGQVPSSIALDAETTRFMSRGASAIFQSVLGKTRRPYLIVDSPGSNVSGDDISARGAAIRSLQVFTTDATYALTDEVLEPNYAALEEFQAAHGSEDVLIYGFTWILWDRFAQRLREKGVRLTLPKATVLHSGGWKKLTDQAVEPGLFKSVIADTVGCAPDRVIDFYGMIENLGIIYPDCPEGLKHPPSFGGVVIRDPVTLKSVRPGETGLLEVCSLLPTSFPGWLLLTEDLAELVYQDTCPCGRLGPAFRITGRAPKSEIRGCGDVLARRLEKASA